MTMHTASASEAIRTLHERLDALRPLRRTAVTDFPSQVREVVVIASSSRGGSSMLAETLRRSRQLLHFQAEINPFLRLAGLGHPDSGTGSDVLDAEHLAALDTHARDMLAGELARDAGTAADVFDEEQFCVDMAWRLTVQWPELPLEPLALAEAVRDAVRSHTGPPDPCSALGGALSLVAVVRELVRQGLPVSPWYYDLPKGALHGQAPPATVRVAPGDFLVEEPPFVVARAWRPADAAELRTKPLVVKTPSNAYRLGFLRALFPKARFRVMHLTRNPAAAVNGLYDGWRHHGFHAHRMDTPLDISGYTDQQEENRWWWKFDLPPTWEAYTGTRLVDVCAFQWRGAHEAVLDHLAATPAETMTVRFEDLISDRDSRITSFEKLSEWLGIDLEGDFRQAVYQGIQPVVATARPRARRWEERSTLIEQAIDRRTADLAARLGYEDRTQWI